MKTQPILYITPESIIPIAFIISLFITSIYFFILFTKYLLKYMEYHLKISSSYPKDQIFTQQMIEAEMYRQYPDMFNTYKKNLR